MLFILSRVTASGKQVFRMTLTWRPKVERKKVDDKLCSAEDVLKLPEHPNPPGVATGDLLVDLLKHQVRSSL